MRGMPEALQSIVESVVESMGYEFVGAEFHRNNKNSLLRVYIDQPDGVGLSDCEKVSHQLSGVLDVEDPISGHYTLEISSPGLDRPLFRAEHFQRFAGQMVRIRMHVPVDGRRKFKGLLQGLDDGQVVVEVEGQTLQLPLDGIEQARLVPEFE